MVSADHDRLLSGEIPSLRRCNRCNETRPGSEGVCGRCGCPEFKLDPKEKAILQKQVLSGFAVIVVDRGFVYVGNVTCDSDWCIIENAHNIRIWGTTDARRAC